MGYWVYELCHGIHVKQFHESKEPKKEPKKPGVSKFMPVGSLECIISSTAI